MAFAPPPGVLEDIALAAIVSGGVLLLTWPWREGAWRPALALGAGFGASHAVARGFTGFFPPDSTMLLFHFAAAATLLGLFDTRLPRLAAWGLRAVFAGCAAWLLLRGIAPHAWDTAAAATGWIGGTGLVALVAWAVLERRADAVTGWVQPLALLVAAAGGAKALEFARTGVLAQMAGALAAALGPLVVFGLLHRKQSLARGAAGVAALVATTLWACGHFFASLPLSSAALLVAAPLAATKRRWWAGLLLTAALTALAVYLAYHANPIDPDDPYAGY